MKAVIPALAVLVASASAAPIRREARLDVSSTAFTANGDIPSEYTCDGANISPPLAWSTVPAATRSIAILVQDVKAQRVLWIVTGIPASTTSLAPGGALPAAAQVGRNDEGKMTWSGPCPKDGRHRYYFTVYALDIALSKRVSKQDFIQAIAGHVLAQGQLVGTRP